MIFRSCSHMIREVGPWTCFKHFFSMFLSIHLYNSVYILVFSSSTISVCTVSYQTNKTVLHDDLTISCYLSTRRPSIRFSSFCNKTKLLSLSLHNRTGIEAAQLLQNTLSRRLADFSLLKFKSLFSLCAWMTNSSVSNPCAFKFQFAHSPIPVAKI